jgi:hypothetical protein
MGYHGQTWASKVFRGNASFEKYSERPNLALNCSVMNVPLGPHHGPSRKGDVSISIWASRCETCAARFFCFSLGGKSTSARRSISRVLSASDQRCGTTIPLGRALRRASRDQPGRQGGNTLGFGSFRRNLLPLFGLAHGGVYPPPTLPLARCALTAPFHPYPQGQRPNAGGMVSVALSLGSPPPAVSRHRVPVEPGLSSKACGKNIAQASAVVRPSGTSKMWCAAPLVNCRKVAQERQAARACRHPAGP